MKNPKIQDKTQNPEWIQNFHIYLKSHIESQIPE